MRPAVLLEISPLILWRMLPTATALILLGLGGLRSSAYVHPDERSHVEAIRYFEAHYLLPEPGTADLYYSEYGRSRVYSGEWPHWILGRVGAVLTACGWEGVGRTRVYRSVGIAAFLLFLWTCGGWRRDRGCGILLSWLFVLIPQVLYLFTYCNSDAYCLMVATLLLLKTVSMVEQGRTRTTDWAIWGGLVAMVGLGRPHYWCVLLPVLGILFLDFVERARNASYVPLRPLAMALMLAVMPAIAWRLEYPKSIGIHQDVLTDLAEVHARDRFKPSHPIAPTMRLKERGIAVAELVPDWMQATLQSSYARFGRFQNEPPALISWCYRIAAAVSVVLLLLSTAILVARRRTQPLWLKSLVLLAPCGILIMLAASLDHSIHGDWQPQGRYLFGMLPAAGLLALCPLATLPSRVRRSFVGLLGLMAGLGSVTYLKLLAEVVV